MKLKSNKGAKLVMIFLVFIFIFEAFYEVKTVTLTLPATHDSVDSDATAEIHKGAWATVVDKARTDPYYKYGIYASRVIAVCHPEVYLKADAMFLRSMEQIISRNKKDIVNLDLNRYQIISTANFYKDSPVLTYLDQRAFSISSTLKRFDQGLKQTTGQNRITQLNKAILYYLTLENTNIYLIYCDNENTYIYCDSRLLWAKTLEEAPIVGNPILIFNEENVWYPLMGRDDTNKDPTLEDIVKKVSTATQIPLLDPFEEYTIEDLKLVTALDDEDQLAMAILSALKTSAYYVYKKNFMINEEISKKWMQLFPEVDNSRFFIIMPPPLVGGVDIIIINEMIRRGNYLSPITAYIASIADKKVDKETMKKLSKSYRDMGFEWSCLWDLMIQGYTIDEALYTNGGMCQVHAHNIASVLDVAEIDNYLLSGRMLRQYTHQINYVPTYDVVFSNGDLRDDHKTILHCPRALFSLSYAGKWAFIVENDYFGTFPPHEVKKYLSFLKKQHNDNIKGVSFSDGKLVEISYDTLMDFLEEEQEKWIPLEIPMTVLPPKQIQFQFKITNLQINPVKAEPGEEVTITVNISNIGKELQMKPVILKINKIAEVKKYVVLDEGGMESVSFIVMKKRGRYHVEVDGLEGEFTVKASEEELLIICKFAMVIAILILIMFFLNQFIKESE